MSTEKYGTSHAIYGDDENLVTGQTIVPWTYLFDEGGNQLVQREKEVGLKQLVSA
jgi:hypothetical protein